MSFFFFFNIINYDHYGTFMELHHEESTNLHYFEIKNGENKLNYNCGTKKNI